MNTDVIVIGDEPKDNGVLGQAALVLDRRGLYERNPASHNLPCLHVCRDATQPEPARCGKSAVQPSGAAAAPRPLVGWTQVARELRLMSGRLPWTARRFASGGAARRSVSDGRIKRPAAVGPAPRPR